jgi:hypothetical protein
LSTAKESWVTSVTVPVAAEPLVDGPTADVPVDVPVADVPAADDDGPAVLEPPALADSVALDAPVEPAAADDPAESALEEAPADGLPALVPALELLAAPDPLEQPANRIAATVARTAMPATRRRPDG